MRVIVDISCPRSRSVANSETTVILGSAVKLLDRSASFLAATLAVPLRMPAPLSLSFTARPMHTLTSEREHLFNQIREKVKKSRN